jgi:hypothetical protein
MTHRYLFALPTIEKKKIKLNVLFSEQIPSRTSAQCRSHHQKMMERYGSIEQVVEELSKSYLIPTSKKICKSKVK